MSTGLGDRIMAKRRKKSKARNSLHSNKKLTRTPSLNSARIKKILGLIGTNALNSQNHATRKRKPTKLNKRRILNRVITNHRRLLEGRNSPSKPSYSLKSPKLPQQQKKHSVCESRSIRKQIMHATKKSGKAGQKKPIQRNPNIICKRSK